MRHEKRVVDAISRGSDIRCCASKVQKHRKGIDEHLENVKNLPKIGDRDPGPRYYWQSIGADGQVSRFLPAALVSLPFLSLAADDVEER